MKMQEEKVTIRHMEVDKHKVFVQKSTGHYMGTGLYLGCEDSPDNYIERGYVPYEEGRDKTGTLFGEDFELDGVWHTVKHHKGDVIPELAVMGEAAPENEEPTEPMVITDDTDK